MLTLQRSDSWVVAGPARTGSFLTCYIIGQVYIQQGITLKKIPHEESLDLKKVPKSTIVHSNVSRMLSMNQDKFTTRNIISFRDPVESVLSVFIRPHIGSWHLRDDRKIDIVPFNLPVQDFLGMYNYFINWYNILPKELKETAYVLDYKDFEDDPLAIPRLLDLPELDPYFFKGPFGRIYKNPGPHKLWFSNWNEIEKAIEIISQSNNDFIVNKPWLKT